MSEIAFLTWDGGGNVRVAIEIAAALLARGQSVTVVGPRSVQRTIESVGVRFADLGLIPPNDSGQRLAYLLAVTQGTDAMLGQLRRIVGGADLLVIDCNLSWALRSRITNRTAVLVHTALGLYLPVWQAVLDSANEERRLRGLPPLAAAAEAWARSDLLLVASLQQFDRPVPPGPLVPVYVGPVAAHSKQPIPSSLSAADDRTIVLISYSTDGLQNSPRRLQTALDALADLPVSVLATTSGVYAADHLDVPANAAVFEYLPHDSVMTMAGLVLCHAGHGTTMAALTRGLPLVCVPGLGRDQEPIAARVSELGLGIALEQEASAGRIRDAVSAVLADGSYRERAREFARQVGHPQGAQQAALELLALLDDRR
jgi:hypothetical protein